MLLTKAKTLKQILLSSMSSIIASSRFSPGKTHLLFVIWS